MPTSPPSPPSLRGGQRVAAAAGVRACPDLRPCLTLVPTEPCDETRPQERGLKKRYRFPGTPTRRLPRRRPAVPGGRLRAAGTRLPLSSSAVSAAATLDLSLTTWKYSPSQHRAPAARPSVQHRPGNETARGGRAGPGALPQPRGHRGQAGGPRAPRTRPLSSPPLTGELAAGWAQIYWQQDGHRSPPPVSSAVGVDPWRSQFLFLSCRLGNPGWREIPLWQGGGGCQKLGVLGCHYLWVAVMTLEQVTSSIRQFTETWL